ncbi:MAG TPA: FmdB family zinc ribbon protein [Phycisphaerae bacterium]|nr:FmdB family zinc ribbon protein [Phycisphaerae bacterium]
MPTYEYQCTKCDRVFEVFHSIMAKPKRRIPTDCRRCDNMATVRRLIGSGAGVLFKGSGFYETDYRSESYKKGAKAEKEAATAAKDGGKSDAASGKSASPDKQPAKKKSA